MALVLTRRMLIIVLLVVNLLDIQWRQCVEGLTNQNNFLSRYKTLIASKNSLNHNNGFPLDGSRTGSAVLNYESNHLKRSFPLRRHKGNDSSSDANIMGIDISHLLKPSLKENVRWHHRPLIDVDLSILGSKQLLPFKETPKHVNLPKDDVSITDDSNFSDDSSCIGSTSNQQRGSQNPNGLLQDDSYIPGMHFPSVHHRKDGSKISSMLRKLWPNYLRNSAEQSLEGINEIYPKSSSEEMSHEDSYEDALTDFLKDQIDVTSGDNLHENHEHENNVFPILPDNGNMMEVPKIGKRSLFISESWKPGGFPDFVITKTPHQKEGSNRNYAYTSVFVSNGWKPGGKRMKYFYPLESYEYLPDSGWEPYRLQNLLSAGFPTKPTTDSFTYPPLQFARWTIPPKRRMILKDHILSNAEQLHNTFYSLKPNPYNTVDFVEQLPWKEPVLLMTPN